MTPHVFETPSGRWAIEFELDGKYQIWYTDSQAQADTFAENLASMGAENAECAG